MATAGFLLRGQAAGVLFVIALLVCAGCGVEPQGPSRLVDEFDRAAVQGTPQNPDPPESLALWDFKSPADEHDRAASSRDWKAGPGVTGLRVADGLLRGRTTQDAAYLYAPVPEAADGDDLLHALRIQMRVSAGANVKAAPHPPGEIDFEQFRQRAAVFPPPLSSPVRPGERLQTLMIRPRTPVRLASLGSLIFSPSDAKDARFEIQSIELISRKQHLARVRSGIGWQGLSEVYHEAIVSRSPETIRWNVTAPAKGWLDLSVGTPEEAPVTFEVRAARSPDGEGELLLERTVTRPHRWEHAPVDLSQFAGESVWLSLSLSAGKDGRLGFWGSPAVRTGDPQAVRRAAAESQLASSAEPPQGVILVVADTLRKDHLSVYGYERETSPQLSRMASQGVLFKDVLSQATWTKVSMPSLMTSLYPRTNTVQDFTHRLPADAKTLAEVYREAGFATAGFSSVLFNGKFTNLHQGYEEFHERGSLEIERDSKTAWGYVDRAREWLRVHRSGPFFMVLHVFDPHDPYEPYRPWNTLWADPARKAEHEENMKKVREFIRDPLMKQFGMPAREELVRAGIDPGDYIGYERAWYDGSIRGMDAEIGRLLEHLRNLGLAEKTLIAFTSDHGEEFLEHGRMFHGQTVYGELTNVPLILYRPGALPAGAVVERTVETVDLMPTLLALSGLPAPERMQGESLLPLVSQAARPQQQAASPSSRWTAYAAEEASRPAFSQKARTLDFGGPPPHELAAYTVVLDGWKLIYNPERPEGWPEHELYDHRNDPLNRTDVAGEHPQVVERLAPLLKEWLAETEAAALSAEEAAEGLTEQELEKLRSLGYIQ